jgi:hypothetical protein
MEIPAISRSRQVHRSVRVSLMSGKLPRFWCALLLGMLLAAPGCNSTPATYPVSGTVYFEDGQPVPFGVIEFRNERNGQSARGKLDRSGRFTLGTFAADDGAQAGSYRAIVIQYFNIPPASAQVQMDVGHQAHAPSTDIRVSEEISNFATSPLRAEVRPEGNNHVDFIVPRHPQTRKIKSRASRISN